VVWSEIVREHPGSPRRKSRDDPQPQGPLYVDGGTNDESAARWSLCEDPLTPDLRCEECAEQRDEPCRQQTDS